MIKIPEGLQKKCRLLLTTTDVPPDHVRTFSEVAPVLPGFLPKISTPRFARLCVAAGINSWLVSGVLGIDDNIPGEIGHVKEWHKKKRDGKRKHTAPLCRL
jgi:hypothetical protein